jgi:hypothetical protein
MTNEQIVAARQIALITLLATAVIVMLFYVYWKQVKEITKMIKDLGIVVLIALGLYDDSDNDSGHTT